MEQEKIIRDEKGRFINPLIKDLKEKSEEIINLYKDKLMNPTKIGKIYGCSSTPIWKILRENNAIIMGRRKILYKEGKLKDWCEGLTKETDKRLKLSGEKSSKTKLYKSSNGELKIWNKNKKLEEIYSIEESKKIKENMSLIRKGKHFSPETEFKKGKKSKEFEEKRIRELKKIKVWNKGLTKENDERVRRIAEEKVGENHPNWLGGKSFEPYTKEFNKTFKLAIKQRDGFMCLKCGMREEDSLVLFKRKLITHHVDYNKKLAIPENCCALCLRCNSEVNKDRENWKIHFQSLLSKLYSYQYSENGEIILKLEENKNE